MEISFNQVSLTFDIKPLFENVDLVISKGERIAVVGRNGMGKSTLLKLITGEITPDSGEITRANRLLITFLGQEVDATISGSVDEVIHQAVSHHEPWQIQHQIDALLDQMGLNPQASFCDLSGGMRRRVLLARAIIHKPDVLLLDEPTNHLDITSIEWLENYLQAFKGTLIFVTHDRALMHHYSDKIIEVDRAKLYSYPGSYQQYLEQKQHRLEVEKTQQAKFDKKLAQEETWLRQGVKARGTRNEGRVRQLKNLRQQRQERVNALGNANLRSQQTTPSGKQVITVENLQYAIDGNVIISNFSTQLLRQDKVGLIGPNGCGKTTFIQLLLKKLTPDQGSVTHGTQLELAYFDQHRSQLDENKTVMENVSFGNEFINFQGQSIHVLSYLNDFLFTAERARCQVHTLSGGERNRLLLAKLLSKPSNLLILDEPTNDLDLETLALLEDLLVNYQGTLLVVSHDRAFLDNVTTSLISFEGDGRLVETVGGFDAYLQQRQSLRPEKKPEITPTKTGQKQHFAKQKNLRSLEQKIEKLEAKKSEIEALLCEARLYQEENKAALDVQQKKLADVERQLAALMSQWEALLD